MPLWPVGVVHSTGTRIGISTIARFIVQVCAIIHIGTIIHVATVCPAVVHMVVIQVVVVVGTCVCFVCPGMCPFTVGIAIGSVYLGTGAEVHHPEHSQH